MQTETGGQPGLVEQGVNSGKGYQHMTPLTREGSSVGDTLRLCSQRDILTEPATVSQSIGLHNMAGSFYRQGFEQ
ncbi:hypothetical protein JZ751_012670 [Albula glossodonta]|uniref:Uncharacterized protein n=1 Tax=Albula glossodonta TaxID=121402 RepID=A0A8T2N1U5_9TELE|nr:hypothetical protein JZ751_012670 [Albula glossodonta]